MEQIKLNLVGRQGLFHQAVQKIKLRSAVIGHARRLDLSRLHQLVQSSSRIIGAGQPVRTMHKEEIKRLIGKVEQKGYTLVPLNLHWKAGKIKCDIALAKGKAEHDKRDTIKDREGKREVERAMKGRNR